MELSSEKLVSKVCFFKCNLYRATRRMIGVDCEMCETDIDPRALIGVSVVDEEGGVLLKVGA